jgi:hypothetical protein
MSPFAPVNQHYLGLLLLLGFTVTAFFAVVSDALPSGPGRHPPSDHSRARRQAGVPGRRSSHSRISFNSPR